MRILQHLIEKYTIKGAGIAFEMVRSIYRLNGLFNLFLKGLFFPTKLFGHIFILPSFLRQFFYPPHKKCGHPWSTLLLWKSLHSLRICPLNLFLRILYCFSSSSFSLSLALLILILVHASILLLKFKLFWNWTLGRYVEFKVKVSMNLSTIFVSKWES